VSQNSVKWRRSPSRDRITIYRLAICAACLTEQEVAGQVRTTVVHEIAHHFGIDDKRLRELGW
jgi:predicted Zn-dependent protease with MMP-like domain